MPKFDLVFPHSYEVEELGDFPGTGKFAFPVVSFPPPKVGTEGNGLWLKIRAASGKAWIGVFAGGYPSPPAISRVVSSPDPNRICVISNGAAYVVRVDEPEVWDQIPLVPVLDVRQIPEKGLLVFSDFTGLAAYGSSGLAWRSPRVCWDELKIVNVTHDAIEGTGYDPTNSITHKLHFLVDLKTGHSLLPAPSSKDSKPVW